MELSELEIQVFDCEVFAHDWLFCFKRRGSDERFSVWNDPEALGEFVGDHGEAVLAGFNSKHYDQYILKAVMAGCEPEEVKEVNDWIIGGGTPWEHPFLKGFFMQLRHTDLMDDMQMGMSLKAIEAHLGMSIVESSVPFDIDRPLTPEEREEVERYCWHDVEAAEALLELRADYLDTKLHLAELADLDPFKALGMTDPKLTAAMLHAEPVPGIEADERDYEFPDRLDYDAVPSDVTAFFERIRAPDVTDEELFASQHVHEFAGCEATFAFGGMHGALPQCRLEAEAGRMLLNYDVSSLYPSLMIEYGYVSRAVPSPALFREMRDERFAAKDAGDKRTASSLKSPLNKAYGAMGNQYNPMYDPRNKLSVCVSGQLSMAELMERYGRIGGLRIVQANTDGVMIDIPEGAYPEVLAVNEEWSRRTCLGLEEDRIELVWQKDVNNYALRKSDGSEKVKGAYLVRGISPVGAWSINNNATIVAEALRRWLLDGTPVADTILACDDPMAFQLVAKASGKYSEVFQVNDLPHGDPKAGDGSFRSLAEVGLGPGSKPPRFVGLSRGDGYVWELCGRGKSRGYALRRKEPMRRCNRVFATRDASLGRLYKVKRADGTVARIESLPEHCLVCNDLPPSILNIDKQWYIALAEKRARDFEKGEVLENEEKTEAKEAPAKRAPRKAAKPPEPDYASMNVWQKLALARRRFLEGGLEKSGVNDHQMYDYFELEDIVPRQTAIFAEMGLLEIVTYSGPVVIGYVPNENTDVPVMSEPEGVAIVVNADNPEERIEFRMKWGEVEAIVSKSTNKAVNMPIQRNGAEETYMRRYLKMLVLDLVEADKVDSVSREEVEAPAEPKSSKRKAPSASKPAAKKESKKPASKSEREAAAESVTGADDPANPLQLSALKKTIKTTMDKYGGDHPEVGQFVAALAAKTDKLKTITKSQAEAAIRKLGAFAAEYDGEGE